jgi:hypothetical protein
MSTFTRLYFVNRGPHLADNAGQDVPEGMGFVAPETIALDPTHQDLPESHAGQLAILPQVAPQPHETVQVHASPPVAHQDAWAMEDQDIGR